MATYLKTGYLDLDTVNIPHHIIANIVVAENGNDVFANFLAYHMNLPLYMAGSDFISLKSLLLGAGLMETALRNTSPVDVAINSSITFGQILNTVPTLALFDAMSAYFGSNLAAIQQLCNSPSCKISLAQHMYTADFDAFMPILFQTDFMKAQTVWSTFMAGPMPPNMNIAVATLKANVNFQLLLRTIVDVFDCNYVLAQYLVFKGPIAFRNQIGTYADLKNCYRNVFGDYFLANIMDLYDRQLLWTHMFATHPAGFWADILISVNPIEFGRIAFKYFPNEANQLMINANISITDYFSLIESYPGLGNAYLSNLKNTLMNMGYTAAGWTYLADEHHIYGSSRVGVHNTHFVLAKRFSTAEMEYTQKAGNQVHFIRGKRNYELSNHLGNVQVVISDKRISVCDNELQTERFEADILMATDYYPFGMAIPERQWYTGSDSSNYRYGFGGHEKDNEVKGTGNHMSFGDYGYSPRTGRRWNIEPQISKYPCYSPYLVFGNNPVINMDPDGEDKVYFNADGTERYREKSNTEFKTFIMVNSNAGDPKISVANWKEVPMPKIIKERTQSGEATTGTEYQENDYLIAARVGYFNQAKNSGQLKLYTEGGNAIPQDAIQAIPDLDPTLIKAIAMQESHLGTTGITDIMQANAPGDWSSMKEKYSLTKGVSPNVSNSLYSGIRILATKGFKGGITYDKKTGLSTYTFQGWDKAVENYNGGGTKNYQTNVSNMQDNATTPECSDYTEECQ